MDATTDPRKKLVRAYDHAVMITKEVDEYLTSRPYKLTTSEGSRCEHEWRLEILRHPNEDWSVRLGELFFNLRSALDQVAWSLASSHTPSPYRMTQFPIFVDAERFGVDGRRQMRDLPPAAQLLIEQLQPFNRPPQEVEFPGPEPLFIQPEPRADGLWRIHTFNSTDKHRLLHPVLASSRGVSVEGVGSGLPRGLNVENAFGPLAHGSVVAQLSAPTEFRSDSLILDIVLDLAIPAPAGTNVPVTYLSSASHGAGGPILVGLVRRVEEVLDHLEPLLTGSSDQ